jgi:hypothetical protein
MTFDPGLKLTISRPPFSGQILRWGCPSWDKNAQGGSWEEEKGPTRSSSLFATLSYAAFYAAFYATRRDVFAFGSAYPGGPTSALHSNTNYSTAEPIWTIPTISLDLLLKISQLAGRRRARHRRRWSGQRTRAARDGP